MRNSLESSRGPARFIALIALVVLPPTALSGSDRTFKDVRDGRLYEVVEIGGLDWFRENLAWATPDSFCNEDNEVNCEAYGRLYRWEQAVSACPPGSHLASELEWQSLERAVGLPQVEVLQRRNRGTVEAARLKPGGDTGFDAKYGGWRRYEHTPGRPIYKAPGTAAALWTSTETDLAHAQHRDIDSGDDMIWRSPVVKHYALSVRCVVDRYGEDEYPGNDTHPVFSPDGSRVAYLSNRVGVAEGKDVNFEIYVLDLESRRERRLTFNDAFESSIAWSPDGSQIAFKSTRDGNDEIYLMSADGSNQTNLTRDPASDGGPSFTSDGRHLVFASDRSGSFDLYRMRSNGTEIELLLGSGAGEHSPCVSPDGSKVAFVSDRDGNDEVYVMQLEDRTTSRITEAPLADWSPIWSPDGNSLVVTHGDWDTDRWSLILISLDGTRREVLFEETDSGNASWREDGALAFGAAVPSSSDEPGWGRVHLGIPGGAGAQQLTGRVAGTFRGH